MIPAPRVSHLPKWLLASQAAVEASAASRMLVQSRIDGVRESAFVLDALIGATNAGWTARLAAKAAIARGEKPEAPADQPADRSQRPTRGLHTLPVELTNCIAAFVGPQELSACSIASAAAFDYMKQVKQSSYTPARVLSIAFSEVHVMYVFFSAANRIKRAGKLFTKDTH